jgi:Zn-dependent M28 family amino/carboxypeptidase
MLRRFAVLLFVALPAASAPEGGRAHTAIDPHAIAAHMGFLAHDALEGREPGTRGFEAAAEYVRAQFTAAGLDVAYQPVSLRGAKVDDSASSLAIDGRPLVNRKDCLIASDFGRQTVDVSAPIVLAGFGVSAPELGYDDYKGIDVHGKIVLLISGAPKTFPSDQRAYYSSGEVKRQNAAAHGAVGILTLSSITDEQRNPFEKRVQQRGITPMTALDPNGQPSGVVEALKVSAGLSRAAAATLFAGAPMTLDAVLADAERGVGHSLPLDKTATAHTASTFAEVKSENVIGTLRGISEEYVVVTAHLDHLGNHPPEKGGDGIYNGAYDNASGIACLIEIAKEMARGPKPKRSVMFVAFTAEEKGDQGSRFFARFPPVPRRSIVADINMDMFLMLYPVADVVLLGGEHSSLGKMAAAAAKASGFDVSPDPYPEEVRFIRSDQYSFVEEGIPAIHIKPGNKSRDASVDGAKVTREWLRNVYHSVRDEMGQPMDFASGARYAETNLRLVRAVANGARPEWVAGDFFAKTFAHGGRKATVTLRVP